MAAVSKQGIIPTGLSLVAGVGRKDCWGIHLFYHGFFKYRFVVWVFFKIPFWATGESGRNYHMMKFVCLGQLGFSHHLYSWSPM